MATIILALEHKEPLDEVLYAEVMFDELISGEHMEHTAFIYEKVIPQLRRWGIPVHTVRAKGNYKSSFYHVIQRSSCPERIGKFRGFPIAGRCCINRDCKVTPINQYLKQYRGQEYVQYIGIASDEKKRLERLDGIQKISLLDKYHVKEAEAMEICREYRLLSPIYEFTERGGCWFCPNSGDKELRHLIKKHPKLWNELKILEAEKNLISKKFNRKEAVSEIEERINRKET